MAATAAQIAQLRRMTVEPDATTYSDALLASYIEAYPLVDVNGYEPTSVWWSPTYDLNAAAADVWQEKEAAAIMAAATVTGGTVRSISDRGATITYAESQAVDAVSTAARMARYYRARRSASTIRLTREDA